MSEEKERKNAPYDPLEIRCPKLGGEVTFSYCRQEDGGLPCSRTITCWHLCFPVELHLKGLLTEDEWDRCFGRPPKDRLTTLLELIEKAKQQRDLSK
jgi:hypothetical protein